MSNYTDRLINSDDAAKIADALYAIANTAPGKRAVPVLTSPLISYDGEEHSFTEVITGFDPDYMIATGDLKADDMGGYTVYIQLKSPNDQWMDGSNDIKVYKWFLGADTVSWANATDETITYLIDLANKDMIDLQEDCGWQIGDARTVRLSAMNALNVNDVSETHAEQDVEFVLMHKGLYKDSNDNTVNYIVGLKDCLNETGKLGNNNGNNAYGGTWNSSARRTWCNSIFYNAVPSTLRSLFKQFKTITAQSYNGSTNLTSLDYFALPAGKEIFGGTATTAGEDTAYTNITEFNALTQFDYYKVEANRLKKVSSSYYPWWTRSYHITRGWNLAILNDGSIQGQTNSNYGISPFGCI